MRTLPAPENGDEIVAGPIAGPITCTYFAQYCRLATRATRAIQYHRYTISISKYYVGSGKHNIDDVREPSSRSWRSGG